MSKAFVTPWTVAHQAPLSMGLPRQAHWSGLPFSPLGDLAHPGIEHTSPALAGRFFTAEPPRKPNVNTEVAVSFQTSVFVFFRYIPWYEIVVSVVFSL